MDNGLTTLSSVDSEHDIETYLIIPLNHLNILINTLELLSKNEIEKIHIADFLKECLFYQEELINLKSSYYNSENIEDKLDIFNQIVNCVCNLFNIEKDLIEDYPDFFKNTDGNWAKYISKIKEIQDNNNNKIKKTINPKNIIAGLLFPAFILFFLYPFINGKINVKNDSDFINIIKINYDRPYNNFFNIYSAVILNKNLEPNFYNLIKSNSFKMSEGFVLIDKNLIVDYYLKEYYGIKNLELNPDVTNIYINNLNYIQCKYILSNFAKIMPKDAYLNEIKLEFNSSFKPEDVCISDIIKMNTFSLNIKKQD